MQTCAHIHTHMYTYMCICILLRLHVLDCVDARVPYADQHGTDATYLSKEYDAIQQKILSLCIRVT